MALVSTLSRTLSASLALPGAAARAPARVVAPVARAARNSRHAATSLFPAASGAVRANLRAAAEDRKPVQAIDAPIILPRGADDKCTRLPHLQRRWIGAWAIRCLQPDS